MSSEPRLAQGPHFPRNRAFLYGESVFTTMRVESGHSYFAQDHQTRLRASADWLWPGTAPQVDQLWSSLAVPGENGVWRITLSAEAESRQLRLTQTPQLWLDDWWTPGMPAEEVWRASSIKAAGRDPEWPAFLKSGDYLARLVAARRAPIGDLPLFHVNGMLTEFLHANIVCWDGASFITPLAGPDVLAGIGRERLKAVCLATGVPWIEREIELSELASFPSVWGVNAVRGIIEIDQIDGRKTLRHPLKAALQSAFLGRGDR